jgi:ankyrin repeat protein
VQIVKFLLEQKAQIEATDEYLSRPLHMAALNGQAAIIDHLIACGADVSILAS